MDIRFLVKSVINEEYKYSAKTTSSDLRGVNTNIIDKIFAKFIGDLFESHQPDTKDEYVYIYRKLESLMQDVQDDLKDF